MRVGGGVVQRLARGHKQSREIGGMRRSSEQIQ